MRLFCKHQYKDRYLSDYVVLLPDRPDPYILTICTKCGKIKDGIWMCLK